MVFWLFVTLCVGIQVWRSHAGGSHVEIGEIVALAVLFIGWLRIVGGRARALDQWIVRAWQINRWLVVYAVWIIAASLVCAGLLGRSTPLRSLREILPAMTLYAVMTLDARRRQVRRLFQYGVLVVILASAGLASLQFLWGTGYVNPINPDAWFKHQLDGFSLITHPVVGFMAHPNGLGLVLAPSLCIASGTLAWRLRRTGIDAESILVATVLVAGTVALWFTQAKMAIFIGVVGMLVAFAGTWSGRPFSARWGLTTLAATCVTGVAGLWAATTVLSVAGGVELGTLWYRVFLAKETLDVVGHSVSAALVGGGLDMYRQVHPIELTVHNEILNQLLKYGAVGAFLFGAAVLRAVRSAQSSGWAAGIALIALTTELLVESANGVQALTVVYALMAYAALDVREESEHGQAAAAQI